MRKLYIFDMDGTLLPQTTGVLQIAKSLKQIEKIEELEKKLLKKEITNTMFAEAIFDLWEDLTEDSVKESFINSPKISHIPEVLKKISSEGGVSCIITSSVDFFAHHFYDFGFDHIFASKPFQLTERKFTPEHILHGKDKPLLAKKLCEDLQIKYEDSIAFGDSASDVPLFQELRHTVSVNGDTHIQKYATYHYSGLDLLEAFHLVAK